MYCPTLGQIEFFIISILQQVQPFNQYFHSNRNQNPTKRIANLRPNSASAKKMSAKHSSSTLPYFVLVGRHQCHVLYEVQDSVAVRKQDH